MKVSLYKSDGLNYATIISEIFTDFDILSLKGKTVFIKPNLCKLPVDDKDKRISVSDPQLIISLSRYLIKIGCKVIIGEANSPRPAEPIELIFEKLGLLELEKEDVRILNISKDEIIKIEDHKIFNEFGLSKSMLESDLIINLCKMKTHAITLYTGALKNFWGAIPRNDRMLLHHKMYYLLYDLNKIYKPQLTIMDAVHCMQGRGPTNGKPKDMNLILASDSSIALDLVANNLMVFDTNKVKHIKYALDKENIKLSDITIKLPKEGSANLDAYKSAFEPAELDLPNRITLYFQRFPFFTHHIVMNDMFFKPIRSVIRFLRKIHVLPE